MTGAATKVRCHCARSADFGLHSWPDGVVLYDEADGSLHVLNPIAGETFSLILQHHEDGCSPQELARALVQGEPEDEDVAMVQGLLREFEAMGLIECAQA